ncbi:MAG: hypothetical protein AAF554_10595 [Bacteroidota bacterium]
MDVIKEIIDKSALAHLFPALKALVLSLFFTIVIMLLGMLYYLIRHGAYMNIQFGY